MAAPILIQRIKSALMLKSPFYGGLMMSLDWIADEAVKTAEVDGIRCRYNPHYVEDLSFHEAVGLFAHETDHCAHADHTRIGDRDLDLFNRAADYRTNAGLLAEGFQLPKGCLIDRRFAGMSAEHIYNILDRERQQNGGGQKPDPKPGQGQGAGAGKPGQGQPQPGQGKPGQGDSIDVGGTGSFTAPKTDKTGNPSQSGDLGPERVKWNNAVHTADRISRRMIGKSPGSMTTLINEMQRGTVDWKEQLRQFMQRCVADRYSWLSPDHRFIHQGWYFPSRESKRIPAIILAVDTSGSVSQRMLTLIAAEINEILGELVPEKTIVIFCDARIHKITEYAVDDYPVTLAFPGRGGTRVRPVFDWIENNDVDPVCVVYFSDMEINDFGTEPAYPVLWGALKKTAAPWGEVIDLRSI